MITAEQLKVLCPRTPLSRLILFPNALNETIEEFGITQVPQFLAQIAHESMGFIYTKELWGPTPAQAHYDLRADLGNTKPDAIAVAARHGIPVGRFFSGHGLIQTTGYDNHCEVRDALGVDCVEQPHLLTTPTLAARSAGLFWQRHGCDAITDFEKQTRRINGGVNGLADRYAYLGRAKEALQEA